MSDFVAVAIGLGFIFFTTTLGAFLASVVPSGKIERYFPLLKGFSGGIMLAASLWSLILPAIGDGSAISVAKVTIGIVVGGAFILIVGAFFAEDENVGFKKLFAAMTAHNIPEGLAVGIALGVGAASGSGAVVGLSVALGIGLQNLPEGAALVLPAREIYSPKKAFLKGAASGVVEPISGAIGFFAASALGFAMPYLTSFAGGSMLCVVFSEMIARDEKEKAPLSIGALIGFVLMMTADVLLG